MATAAPVQTTAIARFEDVRRVMSDYRSESFISLIPTVDMERSPLFRPAVMVVPIDPADPRDVYESPAKDKTVCLRARKLEQIGNAIGVKWLDVKLDRDDKRVTATVYAEYTDAVGDRIPLTAAATEYLTPAKGRTVSTFPEEKAQARARAILVKKLTGLPTSFPPAELKAKDFVGLRWVLDDRQPDIRDAIINRGARAAAQVFGNDAPQKAITAGHVGPEDDDVIDAETSETVAELSIPEAKAATTDSPLERIRARLEAAHSRLEGTTGQASQQQILDIGVVLRDELDLRGRGVPQERYAAVRLAVLSALWGIERIQDFTARQAAATVLWLASDEGRQDVRALYDALAQAEPQTVGAR